MSAIEAMVIRVCGAIRGTVGGVTRSFSTSTIRSASGPIRYNPQVPGSAKHVRRETSEDSAAGAAGVSHSRPLLPKWKQRAPQTDQDWGLRKKEEQKRYWDEQGDGTGSDASAELQRLKTEMKLRESSSTQSSQAPPPSSSQKKNLPVHVEEEEKENHADQPVLAIADLEERPAVARHPAFDNAGLFYGDCRKFEGLNSSSSSSSKKKISNPSKTTPVQGSGLFYGDGRKFATDPFESSVEAMLFEAEEDKTLATEKQAAKTYALRLLGMAPQTAHRLKQKLLGRSVSAPVIESTIADLQRSGLQSDLEYAEAFARSRWRSALWGPQRLKQELKRRGVCSEDVATALEKVFTSSTDDESRDEENEADDEDDEREAAVWGMAREAREHLVAKARQQWSRGGGSVVSAEARKRRMIGWLQRRGFNWSITSRILKLLESDKNSFS